MIGATICSGIGAPEVAMPSWRYSFQSEIEAAPREVLKVRHGAQDARYRRTAGPALWGDFTAIRVRHLRRLRIDLPEWLIAGTPCQAFSIAGLRQSLSDDRGNLTLEFVRLAHALRRAGSLRGFTWENVPGVLSTRDNAFGCLLAAVVGADAPLRSPLERGRWPDAGMVAGPWARAAWRILDAQYFGLAQRRRRVFLVVSFGDGIDPAAVLFERHSLSGHPAPSRETGQEIAGTLKACAGKSGTPNGAEEADRLVIASTGNTSHCLNAGGMGRQDYETETLIAHSLRGEGFDASEDGTGRGTPLVPVAIQERAVSENIEAGPQGRGWQEGTAYTLEARNNVQAVAIPIDMRQASRGATMTNNRAGGSSGGAPGTGIGEPGDPAPTVSTSHVSAVAYRTSGNAGAWETGDRVDALTSAHDSSAQFPVRFGSAVRRLTPRECERLQGFPDDFTLVPYRGRMMADGPRYKMLGNSMAVPVLRWIGERIAVVEALSHRATSTEAAAA